MSYIENTIIEIIKKYTKIDISIDTMFSKENISPIDTIMIILETEKFFNINIPGTEELAFSTVKEYVEYIKQFLLISNLN
jgi:acyl carrier protein